MKKLIVTGGNGFIGSNLVKKLCRKNYFVIIVDKKSYSSNIDNLASIPKKIYTFIRNKTYISISLRSYRILRHHAFFYLSPLIFIFFVFISFLIYVYSRFFNR